MSTPQETQQAVEQLQQQQQQQQQLQQQPQDQQDQQQLQQQLQQQVPQPGTTPAAAPISNNGVGENLQCQWQGCGERSNTAELLYEHVCERHVGRKSTNNLNLTCQWGNCRTTTVKRDHITSHIRVHVPLKPHKCEFCGKAFKRPQDLKKHVKTHADDSVIMRSPEPGQPRPSANMYVANEKGPAAYYHAINPNAGYDGSHSQAPNQYYQPQHPTQGSHPPYGNVYYSAAPTQQASLNELEIRRRGFEALDRFFAEVKARRFDPLSYQTISQRLYELQGLQLPLITQPPLSAIPAYQPVSAVAGAAGGYNSNDPIQNYSLPPMGNAKSRGDLTSIDQILEQMQAAIYENDSQLAHGSVAQPGAHYVTYRTSDSPPGVHLPSAHARSTPMITQQQSHQHNPSVTSAAESVHSSTPALTPPSSAQSYTSGHSPVPPNMTPLQAATTNGAANGNALYPSLPTGTMENGYASSASTTNAATLGGLYEGQDGGRRYGGGMLQHARPDPTRGSGEAIEFSSDGSATPPAAAHNAKAATAAAKRRTRGGVSAAAQARAQAQADSNSVIDPALSAMGSGAEEAAAAAAAAALKSPASTNGGEMTERDAEKERAWVDNMRLIEWIRDYVKKRLEEGDFDEDVEEQQQTAKDVEMGEGEGEGDDKEGDKDGLYPTLKGLPGLDN